MRDEILKCLDEIDEKITVWDIKSIKRKLAQMVPDDEIDYLKKILPEQKGC